MFYFQIKLSDEHLFWEFVTEANLAVDLLTAYSGGKVSDALQLCVDATTTAPDNGTQVLLHAAFGNTPEAENAELAMDDSTEKDINGDDGVGEDIGVDDSTGDYTAGDGNTGDENTVDDSTGDDQQATWGSTKNESEDKCSVLSACMSDPCREPNFDACQMTGYVEKLECKGMGIQSM